jgi:hypothetical protein
MSSSYNMMQFFYALNDVYFSALAGLDSDSESTRGNIFETNLPIHSCCRECRSGGIARDVHAWLRRGCLTGGCVLWRGCSVDVCLLLRYV